MTSSVTPYLTEAEADTYLGTTEPWNSASTEERDTALVNARLYFDENYRCPYPAYHSEDDPDEASDTVKEANAYLANYSLTDSLFTRQSNLGPLEEKESGAGSAKTRKRYRAVGMSSWVDPFPDVTALVNQAGCTISANQGLVTVPVVRA